jgi:hypothetical protein
MAALIEVCFRSGQFDPSVPDMKGRPVPTEKFTRHCRLKDTKGTC